MLIFQNAEGVHGKRKVERLGTPALEEPFKHLKFLCLPKLYT